MLWYAIQVRARQEKVAAAGLRMRGYEVFLPLYSASRRWSDRIKNLELPLFPGYLFCCFDFENRLPILMTPAVITIVGAGGRPIPIEPKEITAIQSIVASGLPAQPWPRLELGQRVRIEDGPLKGVEGIFTEHRTVHRLIVSVSLLQRSVAVEVDSAWLTPVVESQPHLPRAEQTSYTFAQTNTLKLSPIGRRISETPEELPAQRRA